MKLTTWCGSTISTDGYLRRSDRVRVVMLWMRGWLLRGWRPSAFRMRERARNGDELMTRVIVYVRHTGLSDADVALLTRCVADGVGDALLEINAPDPRAMKVREFRVRVGAERD